MFRTGSGLIDAEYAFTRARRASRRAALARSLRRDRAGRRLRVFCGSDRGRSFGGGLREIPLDAIHGTLEPSRAAQFDGCFRPITRAARARWERDLARRGPRCGAAADLGRRGRRRVRGARRSPPRLGGPLARRGRDRRHRRSALARQPLSVRVPLAECTKTSAPTPVASPAPTTAPTASTSSSTASRRSPASRSCTASPTCCRGGPRQPRRRRRPRRRRHARAHLDPGPRRGAPRRHPQGHPPVPGPRAGLQPELAPGCDVTDRAAVRSS